jgi:hypothetical protein
MTISRWILLRMRNVSNKSCKENQNSHFTFSNFFRKPCFHELMSKKWWRQKGRKRQNDGALHVGSVRPHARKHTPASCTHTQTHPHTRKCNRAGTRANTHTHTHIEKRLIFIAFPRLQLFVNAPQMLHYTYIASLLYFRNENLQKCAY